MGIFEMYKAFSFKIFQKKFRKYKNVEKIFIWLFIYLLLTKTAYTNYCYILFKIKRSTGSFQERWLGNYQPT